MTLPYSHRLGSEYRLRHVPVRELTDDELTKARLRGHLSKRLHRLEVERREKERRYAEARA